MLINVRELTKADKTPYIITTIIPLSENLCYIYDEDIPTYVVKDITKIKQRGDVLFL